MDSKQWFCCSVLSLVVEGWARCAQRACIGGVSGKGDSECSHLVKINQVHIGKR